MSTAEKVVPDMSTAPVADATPAPMLSLPVRRPMQAASIRVQVYEELRQQIVSLRLAPGAQVSEKEIAATLNVSRTPVRESLILLGEEKLVEIYPQLGTFIAKISLAEVAEAQFLREALEVASVREAAAIVVDDQLAELRDILDTQRAALRTTDVDAFFAADEWFHHRLMAAGGHSATWRTVNRAKAHLDRARRLSLPQAGTIDTMIAQHSAVVEALAGRRADAVANALTVHLRAVFGDIEVIKATQPELFADDIPEGPVYSQLRLRRKR